MVHEKKPEKIWVVDYFQVRRHSRVLYLPLDYEVVKQHKIKKGDTVKAVTSREEAEKLISLGYEFHYRTADGVDLFRKKVMGLD